MEEGLLPHRRSVADGGRNIEEERRLCYVGVTRAQRELTMSFCKSRMKWGKPRPSLMSRFVMEMRGDTERARRIAEHAEEIFRSEAEAAPKQKPAKKKTARKRARAPVRRG
jgi:DNA helicase-2/ATP-dependent DNA helicase PcrA